MDESQKSPSHNKAEGSELLVAKSPGNSSSGFANTFRILENQIKRKLLKHSSLDSISEEGPSTAFELELAARSRLTEMCDTKDVFKKEPNISLIQLSKLDPVQNYIYHVTRGRNGSLSVKPKRLMPTTSCYPSADDYGKLTVPMVPTRGVNHKNHSK